MKLTNWVWGIVVGLVLSANLPVMAIAPGIVKGRLDGNSATLNDVSFFDVYSFEGEAGESVFIELNSEEFDAVLGLLDPEGNEIAQNDDGEEGKNAQIFIVLPTTGRYDIIVAAFEKQFGSYRLSWRDASAIEVKQAKADELLQQGNQQFRVSQFKEAIDSWEQSLKLYEELGDREGEAASLNNLGIAYFSLGEYQRSINLYQQSLKLAREIGDREGEAKSLSNLGIAYRNLGEYQRAIDFQQQSLAIKGEIGDRGGEANSYISLGNAYLSLGKYQRAINFYQQSLAIQQEIGNRGGEANSLLNLGLAYRNLGEYRKAIDFHQQSLKLAREIGDREGEANSLGNLGIAYFSLGEYQRSINLHQQSLAIDREIGNRGGEANSLNNLGIAYFPLGEYQRSINLHQQSLAIDREIGNREGAGRTLNNIGTLFDFQEQPELAIVFYKESVNVREGIRGDISSLTRQLQESYASTIAGTYRRLADLLLSQGRILEAQQVLELLKIQEIRDYIRSRNAGGNVEDLIFLVEELEIRDQHGQLIVFDQKLAACKQTRCPDLSQLRQQRDDLKREYNQAIRVLEESISQRQAQGEIIDPNNLPKNARDILNTQPGTMLIYPFVTDDKLWLLLATQGGLPSVRQIPVSQGELSAKVLKLRELLQDAQSGTAEIQEISQQLYRWLITPLEEELTTGEIKHLVFALDRAVRYIPMGVLFDGNNYLIEKYTVTTIISAELTDTRERLPSSVEETSVLAMGLSEASEGFNPLPHVETEIDAIVREEDEQPDALGIYPGSKFINSNFNWDNLTNNLEDRQILHIATHGNFSPVSQENSFLLLGDRKLPVSEIQLLDEYLEDVHLVVLSACQTALADNSLQIGDGNEINSISFHFLNAGIKGGAGPKALLASLWNVNDEKTSQLMESFYQNLAAESGIAKAKALQQAQLSFLTDSERSHPYYWAPFILIGNGL